MMPLAPSTKLIRLLLNLFLARFSPGDIERATRTPIRIGLAGDKDLIENFKALLVDGTVAPDEPFPSLSLHPMPPDEKANAWQVLDDCQLIVVLLGREHLLGDTIYRIKEALPKKVGAIWAACGTVEPWLRFEVSEIGRELKLGSFVWLDELTKEGIMPLVRDLVKSAGSELSLGRKMPFLRDYVATRIIQRTSRQNLLIAMASALPATLPWIGPIVGILGVSSEIVFLTANQLRMVLTLASLYGLEMNPMERISEILPIVGGAFGWRALSRELVGFIPVAGPGIKGSIAFAGTTASGEAARWYYKTGKFMKAEDRARIYQEAYEVGSKLTGRVANLLPQVTPELREELQVALEDPHQELPAWTEKAEHILEEEPPATNKAEIKMLQAEADEIEDSSKNSKHKKPKIKKPERKETP